MEAKRVVFVSLKPSSSDADAGTSRGNRRKRALGIEENATWEEFTAAVCARLQIAGLRAVYHASTGERVQGVGDVQDIEDLVVEEDESVRIIPDGSTPGASPMRTPSGRYGASPSARTPLDEDEDGLLSSEESESLVEALGLQLNVEDDVINKRRSLWKKPIPRYTSGILGKFSRLVGSSSKGALTDRQ